MPCVFPCCRAGLLPIRTPQAHDFRSLPTILPIVLAGLASTIGFQTIPGKTYRVEYKDDLNVAQWQQLNNLDYLAAGPSLTVLDNISGHPQRFYRIVQLD